MPEANEPALPPFRFSPQVGILIAIVLLALVIPVVAISYYFRADSTAKNATFNPAASAPLQASLESIAEEALAGNRIKLDSDRVIVLKTSESSSVEAQTARFLDVAKMAGASVVDLSSADEKPLRRWSVIVPAGQGDALRGALNGDKVDFNPGAARGGDTEILTVEIHP